MPPAPRDLRERLMEKVIVLGPDACWQWTGATNGNGYGRIWTVAKRDKEYAHRVSYELANGPIPNGLEIDHLCRNRACVNPDHLEAVTRKENQNRGYSVTGKNLRKTHCPQGHPYDEENTYRPPTGGRQCALCRAEYRRVHAERLADDQRRWRVENRDRVNAYRRAWREKRREAGLPT